jgi:hypothetical protein
MPIEDPNDLERIDQQIRINELKEKAREITGDNMTAFESSDAPPEVLEQFWENVKAIEEAPPTSEFEQLSRAGLSFPPPEQLTDNQLHEQLWRLIQELAKRNTFLYHTDHLSDRELYTHLLEESLHEMMPDLPEGLGGSCGGWTHHIDLIGSGSEEDIDLGFIYYEDDRERAHWMEQFPDYVMPERKPKPYDRDHLLPLPPEERERRAWLAEMHAKGYTDEDIERLCREEFEKEAGDLPDSPADSDDQDPAI